MKIKLKEKLSYLSRVLREVQKDLGRTDIGISGNNQEFELINMDRSPLVLTVAEEARIKSLTIIAEKLP